MGFLIEVIKFIIYSLIILYLSKQVLVKLIRKIAEVLDLSPKSIGNIAGASTSMPELLTVLFSSLQGLFSASIYNIISSNVINFIQYICSILINKNGKTLRNNAIRIEIGMVIVSIIIPIFMIITQIDTDIKIVPIFIFLFIIFYYIRGNVHKIYKVHDENNEDIAKIEEEKRWIRNKKKVAIISGIELIGVGIILFFVGNLLREYT